MNADDFKAKSIAWCIQRMMDDIAAHPDMKQLGPTHKCSLIAIQRMPFAERMASKLKRQDIIEFMKWRRQEVVAATANQTISMLLGVCKYVSATWEDCEDVANAVLAIQAAKPYLGKHQLVGKSTPRTRRPTDEEIDSLLTYYRLPGRARHMVDIILFALVSSRRSSEICRITWRDIDFEGGTYWVRNLKHPKKKEGNDKKFVLWPELAEIIKRQPKTTSERVFPFNSKSASASYTVAKKRLKIEGLRFHDNRASAISKWLLKMPPQDVRLAVSGHNNTHILETVYDRRDPAEVMKLKYADQMRTP